VACSAALVPPDEVQPGSPDAGNHQPPPPSEPDGGTVSGSPDGGTVIGSTTATIRVHYPAGTHTLAVRGGATPLSWAQGAPMNGTNNTYVYTISHITGPIEWKPLLDDNTWALGPNYHVSPGQTIDIYPRFNTPKGRVVTLISSFHSNLLNNDRPIYAYYPASYDENTTARYPVVYMHDGQNLWAALPQLAFSGTWNVDTAFDNAGTSGVCSSGGVTGWGAMPLGGSATTCTGDGDCTSGECRTFPEAIVIGVGNTANRIPEYTPTSDPTYGGGNGDQYLKMLITELKPQIDSQLRTLTDRGSTAMIGSSLGGLISAYAGTKNADVFGRIGAISPSTWWDNTVLLTEVAATPASPRPLMVYVDSGGSSDDQTDTDNLAAAYVTLGYVDGVNFRHVVQPSAVHSETYWAQRLPGALQLLLGSR
jgi:predicted alpha/beta superfamily hydrolase